MVLNTIVTSTFKFKLLKGKIFSYFGPFIAYLFMKPQKLLILCLGPFICLVRALRLSWLLIFKCNLFRVIFLKILSWITGKMPVFFHVFRETRWFMNWLKVFGRYQRTWWGYHFLIMWHRWFLWKIIYKNSKIPPQNSRSRIRSPSICTLSSSILEYYNKNLEKKENARLLSKFRLYNFLFLG